MKMDPAEIRRWVENHRAAGARGVPSAPHRVLEREDVLAYANRDWNAIAEHKRRAWSEIKPEMTATDALDVAGMLSEVVSAIQPSWPTDQQRLDDLATHIRVSEMLRRAQSIEHR
ncbi:MAG TPA: hypothetical protein VHU41_19620 [Thermoanaerobaculia bacterium]|jgi:hypothetical protein|nr:hypothetical protein [Thermoanaerobaculia bacterium]